MGGLSLLIGPAGWGHQLLGGLALTLELALLSFAIGSGLGLLAALGELSRMRPLALALEGYAAMLRSVPELLVIFLIYFGGSFAIGGILSLLGKHDYVEVSAFWAGTTALSLIQGAYTSEVFRGAILAVPWGLVEAARSLGMGPIATFRLVTLPIALRYAFPGLCNMWMVVIKNTPFVSAIGLQDLIRTAGTAGDNTKQFFVFYAAVLATYLALSGMTMAVQASLDRRLFRHLVRDGRR
jgi:His/Glu/Gln/Arg/opine family amino acid ABC transporter permease subunit